MRPGSDEALAVAAAQGSGEIAQHVSHQSISGAGCRKALITIAAQLAMRGYALHELADGSLSVSRWNLSCSLLDLAAAKRFLLKIGGAA